jgi:ESX secretion system protein EccE
VKARTVALRPALSAVVAAEAVALIAFTALPPSRFNWWPAAVITAAAVVLLVVTVHRRNAVSWVAAQAHWRRQRRFATPVGAAVDINHGGHVYGVRTAGDEAVTMLRIDGRADSPTFLRSAATLHTTNTVPLRVLLDHLDQPGGLHLGVDIVNDGYRVVPQTGYPPLYSTLLADRSAAGQRTTRLIVRLILSESVAGLAYRHSVGTAAAAATDRILKALMQHGIRAVPLTAEEQDAALAQLGVGLAVPPPRPTVTVEDEEIPPDIPGGRGEDEYGDDEFAGVGAVPAGEAEPAGGHGRSTQSGRRRHQTGVRPVRVRPTASVGWRTINTRPGYLTTYYFSPEDITTESLNQMWALRADHIVQVTTLRKQRDGKIAVSAMVRTDDPQAPQQPPTLFLNPLPGEQYAAAVAVAPTSQPRLKLPQRVLTVRDDLAIPIGATGVLVGAAINDDPRARPAVQRDDLVMWPLTDPQRATRITMDTSAFYLRQLLIRAAACGERIAIYSREPARWYSLAQRHITVVEPGRRADFVPTIIVNDRSQIAAGLSSTVITLGREHPDGAKPDVLFHQTSENTVRISAGARVIDIAMVVFRQEQTWTG